MGKPARNSAAQFGVGHGFRHLLLLAIMLICGGTANALDPQRHVVEYHHASFGARDGAPSDVMSFAQASDGSLWLGSGSGLYRFDGFAFEAVPTLGGEDIHTRTIITLRADEKGGLWIGYGGAGAGYYSKDGKYTAYGAAQGWTTTQTILTDLDGTVWVDEGNRVAQVVDGVKHRLGADWNLPDASVSFLIIDKVGTIWVSMADERLRYLPRGERRFRVVTPDFRPTAMVAAPDGSIWADTESGLAVLVPRGGVPDHIVHLAKSRVHDLLFDRDGGLWFENPEGIVHVGAPGKLLEPGGESKVVDDRLERSQGLGTSAFWRLFEDREGNVWLGTSSGLERFRDSAFVPLRLPGPEHGFAVTRGLDGTVWAANWDSAVLHVSGRQITPFSEIEQRNFCLYTDALGGVWVGGGHGVKHSADGQRLDAVPVPLKIADNVIASMAMDKRGSVWVSTVNAAPFGIIDASGWHSPSGIVDMPEKLPVYRIFTDGTGRVWLFSANSLYAVEAGRFRTVSQNTTELGMGRAFAFAERGSHIWFSGSAGVALFDGTRFRKLKDAAGQPFADTSGIVERADGELWLHTVKQAVRIPAKEMGSWFADEHYDVRSDRFDALDGLHGAAPGSTARPTLAESTDGTLWFSTNTGLSSINPDKPVTRAPLPIPVVRGLTADGKAMDVRGGASLPPLTKQLALTYTAPSLAIPERTTFRYRLDGLDKNWQEVGSRRTAFYTNLNPGHYRFRVAAAVMPGGFDGKEAVMDFDVQPAWFQTLWFRLLLALVVLTTLWLLHELRLRLITARDRIQERARLDERERVSREVHDTILQGTQALVWKFRALAQKMPASDPVRADMELTLSQSNEVLTDARARVMDLRKVANASRLLSTEISEIGSELASSSSAVFNLRVVGVERQLRDSVFDDLSRLLTEGLRNAFRHGNGTRVDLELIFSRNELRCRLTDDGRGMDAETAESGKANHLGIPSMRERARELNASLDINSTPRRGTEIVLRLKAADAF